MKGIINIFMVLYLLKQNQKNKGGASEIVQ